MKSPKNRKKSFRVDCINCHSTQDSLLFSCTQCKQRLYTNMEAEELSLIAQQVDEMEGILAEIENPKDKKGNPYQPVDRAWAAYRTLRASAFMPGMPAYLDRVLEVLLPTKVRLLQRTLKANWIFLGILSVFPIVTLLFRFHAAIVATLAVPALVWLVVTLKAANDLKRTKARLEQASSAS